MSETVYTVMCTCRGTVSGWPHRPGTRDLIVKQEPGFVCVAWETPGELLDGRDGALLARPRAYMVCVYI